MVLTQINPLQNALTNMRNLFGAEQLCVPLRRYFYLRFQSDYDATRDHSCKAYMGSLFILFS